MYPEYKFELKACYSRVSLALIAYTALTQLTSELVMLPYYLGNDALFFNDWYYYFTSAMIYYPAGLLVFWLLLRDLPTPRLRKGPPPRPGQLVSCVLVAMGVLYASSYLTELLLSNTDTVDYANEAVASEPLLFSLLATVILAPICEELIFRRLLLDRLLFLGDWSALLISSLFFGLFHTNLYQFLYACAAGMVLGYVRIMTGRVSWSIALHMFINLFCGVLPGYLPEAVWADVLLEAVVLGSIVYAVIYLLANRPWREFYPGPTSFSAGEKCAACLSSVPFWLCVGVHLLLSVYYIVV